MTKSFTAAAVLALRDEGALRLDDPVASHVPESANAFAGGDDAPAVTIRDLLTMSSGLVTDNHWGDRQESMTRDRKSTRLNSSHVAISYAVFCLKKKKRVNISDI